MQRIGRIDQTRLTWLALGVLLVGAALLLWHETRGTTFWLDEWTWILHRRGSNVDAFLTPHNGHLSLVPVAIYKLLWATAGLDDYRPYRGLLIAGQLACGTLVFVYASRRVGGLLALAPAAVILFLGPGWQDILSPFQVAWLISLAAGVGALLMLDRNDKRGDVAASALLALSLASSGLGIALALGLAVDVLWGRRRWRDAWIVAAPLALYGVWWLVFQDASYFHRHNIVEAPRFVADAAAGVMSGLSGLTGHAVPDSGPTILDWGRPLAVAAVAVVGWRLLRLRPIPPRVLALLTIVLSFWVLTALNRADISAPYTSRYLYVGALVVVLLAVEMSRGVSVPWRVGVVLAVAVSAAIASNIGALRDASRFLRDQAQLATADRAALQIARPVLGPGYVARAFPGTPLLALDAGSYFAAMKQFGSRPPTPRVLATEPEGARKLADTELISAHRVALAPSPRNARPGTRPTVEAVAGGTTRGRDGCVTFVSGGTLRAAATGEVDTTVPPSGVVVTARGGPATIGVRRFADEFQTVGTLAASSSAVLRIGPDLAAQPWHIRVAAVGGATVCGLA